MHIDERNCGCFIEITLIQGAILKRAEINYCPTHSAAPELQEILRKLLDKTDTNDWNHLEVYKAKNLLATIDGKPKPYPLETEYES